jgi:cell division protein FtsL
MDSTFLEWCYFLSNILFWIMISIFIIYHRIQIKKFKYDVDNLKIDIRYHQNLLDACKQDINAISRNINGKYKTYKQ